MVEKDYKGTCWQLIPIITPLLSKNSPDLIYQLYIYGQLHLFY